MLRITNKRNPIIFNYTLHDHILATVTQAKYLGVTITNDLNWKQHVENISKSANKALGFLRRNLRINSVKAKEQAYLTYVRPILEYSCTVWDPYRIYQQRQLEMVQRRAARFVCNRYRQTSSVTNMMAGLDWEPLIKRRRAFRMIMFYKMHSGLLGGDQRRLSFRPRGPRQGRARLSCCTSPFRTVLACTRLARCAKKYLLIGVFMLDISIA